MQQSMRSLMRLARSAARAAETVTAATGSSLEASMAKAQRTNNLLLQALRPMSSAAAAASATSDSLKPKMFCYQCEQTANGTGCSVMGQCGKTPEVAGLQDLLVFSLKGLGALAHHARTSKAAIVDPEIDGFLLKATFSTLTNVNFNDARFQDYIHEALKLHARLTQKLKAAGMALPQAPPSTAWFEPGTGHPLDWNARNMARADDINLLELIEEAKKTGVLARQEVLGKTVAGLQELIVYGLKGLCAYAAHADALGARDPAVMASVQSLLHFLGSPEASDVNQLLGKAMELGTSNFRVMQMLSEAHCAKFGNPSPQEVSLTPRPGKAILVTGHDLHDLHELLKQTEGTGIDVYTHGEMLPAHGYPGLRKFKHLAGHYGGAWYKQKMDFAYFPGAILATTNCVIEPMALYRANLFTTNETGLSNVAHIPLKADGTKDFSALIARAQALTGWNARNLPRTSSMGGSEGRGASHSSAPATASAPVTKVTTGFGHHVVLSVADKVIDAVQKGKLKHIFLVGGCDGHEPQRAYYGQLGKQLPKDTMLLTLGCGKFRLLDQDFGTLGDTGLPRLLDMGQCNDAYSALVVATELAKAFKTDVNSLPLSLDISWFEQKAVAVLLTLLSLGVKNIRLGPALPAFLTPEALGVLVEKFAIKPADTSNPDQDLLKMMAKQ